MNEVLLSVTSIAQSVDYLRLGLIKEFQSFKEDMKPTVINDDFLKRFTQSQNNSMDIVRVGSVKISKDVISSLKKNKAPALAVQEITSRSKKSLGKKIIQKTLDLHPNIESSMSSTPCPRNKSLKPRSGQQCGVVSVYNILKF
ncbi:hypothetical protein ACH5RR_003594 [Cinchona calisaya]|uniref:Uncharacterized protein n=1 Tax=Cinchona calisaya TaxID=153742 RepID=A0ABD3AV88_9GENT